MVCPLWAYRFFSLGQCFCCNAKTVCYGNTIFPTADCFSTSWFHVISFSFRMDDRQDNNYATIKVFSFFSIMHWISFLFYGMIRNNPIMKKRYAKETVVRCLRKGRLCWLNIKIKIIKKGKISCAFQIIAYPVRLI